ncbi:hypothetical protein NEOLI_002492, partial [Neolecta irregularis DAH-3]
EESALPGSEFCRHGFVPPPFRHSPALARRLLNVVICPSKLMSMSTHHSYKRPQRSSQMSQDQPEHHWSSGGNSLHVDHINQESSQAGNRQTQSDAFSSSLSFQWAPRSFLSPAVSSAVEKVDISQGYTEQLSSVRKTTAQLAAEHPVMEVSEPPSPVYVLLPRTTGMESSLTQLLKNSPSPPIGSQALSESRIPGEMLQATQAYEDLETQLLPLEDNGSTTEHLSTSHSRNSSISDLEEHYTDRKSKNWTTQFRKPVDFAVKSLTSVRKLKRRDFIRELLIKPAKSLPAVMLGSLLNILDALSYGMILFPLSSPVFKHLGPDGISMFYVSCIISQLVFSCGGSIFRGGIGSEMIEVVPFFHQMAFSILSQIGEDKPAAVISTTIASFAMSSIITGIAFLALGCMKLGSLTGFFPRHILVGCIGGVGWFLFITGIEVCTRLPADFAYDLETIGYIFQSHEFLLWIIPFSLALLLLILQRYWKNSSYLVPAYFVIIPAIFHIITAIVPQIDLSHLRKHGWVFQAPKVDTSWYHFYTLFDFAKVDWAALISTIPIMLALTFFGILHVPINVPSLGISLNEDDVNLDRELIAHGISNALSGCLGSVQNYLVYTNSLLFIRSGGNSRLAGILLAAATTGILLSGPAMIGFIPVMVVGALIFNLGMDLLREALVDTWDKLDRLEYFTVVAIIFSMAAWDFVFGILVGIVLACLTFVLATSRKRSIRAVMSGTICGSTVRRPPFQQRFLKKVGHQIQVIKLGGHLFFGTIAAVETEIKERVETRNYFSMPIRYLIMDFSLTYNVDFSAAEAFKRIKRSLDRQGVQFVLCGVTVDSEIGRALRFVGVWDTTHHDGVWAFETLNAALEICENELLQTYTKKREAVLARPRTDPSVFICSRFWKTYQIVAVDLKVFSTPQIYMQSYNSPRQNLLRDAANDALREETAASAHMFVTIHSQQPFQLLKYVLADITDKGDDFWIRLASAFVHERIPPSTILWRQGATANEFYVLETGILKATYDFDLGENLLNETILSNTLCGELPFLSETPRTATVAADTEVVAWKMNRENWNALDQDIRFDILKIGMRLTCERMSTITSYVCLVTSTSFFPDD